MKRLLLAAAACAALAAPARAQLNPNNPVGQGVGGINQGFFNNNTPARGFESYGLTASASAPATATTQATAQLIVTVTTYITGCSATTGFVLPSIYRYAAIVLINRSGGSCLIWPSPNATLETAPGTVAAVNAPFTLPTNTDVIFRPVSATAWVQ